jgi:transcription elongation factor GreA
MKNYTTKNGYKIMLDELNHLTNFEYRNAIDMLKEARDKGDLSENAEYETAKEYQTNVINKIASLKEKLRTSEIIENTDLLIRDIDTVNMLSTIEIKNHKMGIIQVLTLVSESEIDTKNGKISFNSPIGSALIGHRVGDIVNVNVPSGVIKLEILKIKN